MKHFILLLLLLGNLALANTAPEFATETITTELDTRPPAPIGTFLIDLGKYVRDVDGDMLTWSVLLNTDGERFKVDGQGIVSLSKPISLNISPPDSHTIRIGVSDDKGGTDAIEIQMNEVDNSPNSPVPAPPSSAWQNYRPAVVNNQQTTATGEAVEQRLAETPKQRRVVSYRRCGLGWSPRFQYQHFGELPKVMIYALEFEYDPERHGTYICKTIEIRTGDDSIENLAGWNLYLGTLYNPSRAPLTVPEEYSQVTDNVLRITPEMLGLQTFPCSTVNGISHPLPGVQYVLKTDENVLIDTAYSCFVWGQTAYTTVDGVNVKSQRSISSAVLREMETPRLERYISNATGVYITYMDIEAFTWDRVVLSDWLLPLPENPPAAPRLLRTTVSTWAGLKQQ